MMKLLLTIATIAIFIAASPAAAQGLRQTPFDDGTGSIGLPPGWQINNAYRGSVTCIGPNGGIVVLGMPWTIVDADDTQIRTLPSVRQQPMARVGDIVNGWREVLLKRFGARLLGVRGNRTTGFARGVPAYHLLYVFEQNGVRYMGMGYFTALYTQGTPAWQLYSSYVVASSETFQQTVQTMVSMWSTWRPNGQEPREGSTSAMWDRILRERRLSYEFWQQEFREQL
jgi:hypothetical protein